MSRGLVAAAAVGLLLVAAIAGAWYALRPAGPAAPEVTATPLPPETGGGEPLPPLAAGEILVLETADGRTEVEAPSDALRAAIGRARAMARAAGGESAPDADGQVALRIESEDGTRRTLLRLPSAAPAAEALLDAFQGEGGVGPAEAEGVRQGDTGAVPPE